MSAAGECRAFRTPDDRFRGCFETISGSGPNGAIVHYRVTPEAATGWRPGTLSGKFRCPVSGCGTTGITRTVFIEDGDGAPSEARKVHTGSEVISLSRPRGFQQALWQPDRRAGKTVIWRRGWITSAPATASASISAFTRAAEISS